MCLSRFWISFFSGREHCLQVNLFNSASAKVLPSQITRAANEPFHHRHRSVLRRAPGRTNSWCSDEGCQAGGRTCVLPRGLPGRRPICFTHVSFHVHMIVSMAKFFHEARFSRYLTNELARFVAGIHTCRREAFASLSKRGPLNPLRVALERVALPDQSD